ncbi:MAG: MFS transporter [Acidobacteria bacterium]|nr:MFS transporter [Acidobacteriota bacterium]
MHDWQRNQVAVTAAAFVGFTGFTLVMPFLPLYIRQLGVTDVGEIALWAGVTVGATPAITALCAPFWGRVGDRLGNKLLVQRSLLSFILVMGAMAYATEAWHLFALRVVQGFFAGYGPLTLSMAALSAPRDKIAIAIGTVQTAQRMGPALGPVIGGVLAPLVGLRNAFLASAALYAVAFILLTLLYTEPAREAARGPASAHATFASVLALENLLVLMFVLLGLQLVERSFGPVLPLYLGQLGYRADVVPLFAGALFSVLAFSGAAGNQLAARLLARLSPRTLIATSVLASAAALAAFSFARTSWILVSSMAIAGLGLGTSMTAVYAAAGAVIPRHVHATAFGVLTSASLIGVAASPVLSGLVAARSIRVVFIAGAAALVAVAAVVRRLMVDRSPSVESTPAIEES